MAEQPAVEAGRLFEAGFMLGVTRALCALPHVPQMLYYYRTQRQNYNVADVIKRFAEHIPSDADQGAARMLARYHLLVGHITGYTFLNEYLDTLIGRAGDSPRRRERIRQSLRVRYWQCSLLGRNRLEEALPEVARQHEVAAWLRQVDRTPSTLRPSDSSTGGFLNADLLLWFALDAEPSHAVLVVDTSSYGSAAYAVETDLTLGSSLLHMLERDVLKLQQKGSFTRIAVETGKETGTLFTSRLRRYFSAFATEDKESYKLIQAASYAWSFTEFLRREGLLTAGGDQTYHAVGCSPRGMSSMALRPDQAGLLEACAAIYREGKNAYASYEEPLEAARADLLRVIGRNVAPLFQDGATLVHALTQDLPTSGRVEHHEQLQGTFQNTAAPPPATVLEHYGLTPAELARFSRGEADLRAAHAALVWRALASERRYLFLTGNPGIGKTTTVANYLVEACAEQGFLLFYASPRKTVNRDVFEKFRVASGPSDTVEHRPFALPHLLGLTSNAALIRDAGSEAAVEYVGAEDRVPLKAPAVRFISTSEASALRSQIHPPRTRRIRAVSQETLREQSGRQPGVLYSICKGISSALDQRRPNALVAAVAIQSLKRDERGQDTLRHLIEIFGQGYTRGQGLSPDYLRQLAKTTRHLIFMIDEIAGDAAGFDFLQRVDEFCRQHRLEDYGFRVTIIVSDASIAGLEVVRAHFALDQREPDARKIYLTLASRPDVGPHSESDSGTIAVLPAPELPSVLAHPPHAFPLSLESFCFGDQAESQENAYLVNSNSFPASALRLRYVVRAPVQELGEQLSREEKQRVLSAWRADQDTDHEIVRDICALLAADPNGEEQAIVFVQNKVRLQTIIDAVQRARQHIGQDFTDDQDYTQIHAENSEAELARVATEEKRARFRVIFVTSSASRGLSFPKARHLLIDVPRFNIEENLMEIVQVLYRGRGGPNDLREKDITFYFTERVLAPTGRRAAVMRESVMGMMTMLCLLKLCVVTRIAGAALLHERAISLIPIGGKSVSGTSAAFHHDLAGFVAAVRRAMRGPRTNDPNLRRVHTAATRLLESARFELPPQVDSYLTLYDEAIPDRIDRWLVSDEPIERAYTHGSLLVIPLGDQQFDTIHRMHLGGAIAFATADETRQAIRNLFTFADTYAPSLLDGLKAFRQLLAELDVVARSQNLEYSGKKVDGYCVIPMAVLVAKDAIAAYCQELAHDERAVDGEWLRHVLLAYVRDAYPIDTALPIGSTYRRYPFLLITSQDLAALRAKRFCTGHALMSPEMNLLTLILAEE